MLARLQLSDDHGKWLEAARRIPCETAAEFGVVSKGNLVAFEYRQRGATSFLKIRREIVENGERTKTFWIEPKGAELCLWNEDCLTGEPSNAPLIITEGEFDALSFLASGATHVVSVPNGAPKVAGEGNVDPRNDRAFAYLWQNGKLKKGLQRFTKIIIATDSDEAGVILRDELAIRLGRTRCWYVTYPDGCKDANDVLQKHGEAALQDMIADARPIVPSQLVPFSAIPARSERNKFGTGWAQFDHHFQLVPPQLIVVTGRPNAGKSQWTLCLVANLARVHGLKGAILQFEDNPDRNRKDLISYAKAWSIEDPKAWIDQMFKTIAPCEDLDDDKDFNLSWLHEAIEEAACRHGCKWILIDPWNEVEHLWGRQDTEATYLNRAVRQLKKIARRFEVSIFVVTHPTKEGGKSQSVNDASLYDINGGAVWNNKADIGIIVWADDVVDSFDRKIKVAKSKDFMVMGAPGTVTMRLEPGKCIYTVIPS